MSAGTETAKQRFRRVATGGRTEQPRLGLDQAKARLRSAADGFEQIGDELVRCSGMAELSAWVRKEPWRATLAAAVGGFLAGNLKESEVLVLGLLFKLLNLPSAQARQK